jgi:hypothetical protein
MTHGLDIAKKALAQAQQRHKAFADKSRRDVVYAPGDFSLVNAKNIHLKMPGIWTSPEVQEAHGFRKLMPKWISPIPLVKAINHVAYRLELPESLKVHNVFHVSLHYTDLMVVCSLRRYHKWWTVSSTTPLIVYSITRIPPLSR